MRTPAPKPATLPKADFSGHLPVRNLSMNCEIVTSWPFQYSRRYAPLTSTLLRNQTDATKKTIDWSSSQCMTIAAPPNTTAIKHDNVTKVFTLI
jgi:hypothetical protein